MLNRNLKIPVPCPKCQHKVKETIARLETNPTLTCPACSAEFGVKAEDLARGLKEVEKLMTEFQRKASVKIKLKK